MIGTKRSEASKLKHAASGCQNFALSRMVVAYTVKGDSFVADQPRLWSETHLANVGVFGSYDVAPDGRVAALMPAETPEAQQAQSHEVLLLNFFDEVLR